jgi:hypothetical protein
VITDVVSSQGVPTRPDDYTGERADLAGKAGCAWLLPSPGMFETEAGTQVMMYCAGSKPVEVFFSNPDLLWANDHPRSRYGQVSLMACILRLDLPGLAAPHGGVICL